MFCWRQIQLSKFHSEDFGVDNCILLEKGFKNRVEKSRLDFLGSL